GDRRSRRSRTPHARRRPLRPTAQSAGGRPWPAPAGANRTRLLASRASPALASPNAFALPSETTQEGQIPCSPVRRLIPGGPVCQGSDARWNIRGTVLTHEESCMPEDPVEIRLIIPGAPEFLRLARLAAADAGSRAGLTYDEIEDLRIGVDELCHSVMRPD